LRYSLAVLIGLAELAPSYVENELNASAVQQQDLLLAQARNNHGYDAIPTWAIDECDSKGACCDVHDDCFSRYGCNVSSWVFGSAQCQTCNTAVVNCFRNSNLGPSRCCRAGNCGRPIIG
jgi:hypothetical protein